DGNQLRAVLTPSEIRRILGRQSDTNIYKKLKSVSKGLAGNVIQIEDGNGQFKTFSMITNVDYLDRHLVITYNKEMTPHISKLKSNYTTYELAVLMGLERSYTFRLYEVLKKDSFKITNSPTGQVVVKYNVSEIKGMIGLINTDAPYIKDALSKGATWDEIVSLAKKEDKQFDNYGDFRKRVLEPARIEMQDKCDICFDYTTERNGGTNKITDIVFYIRNNDIASDDVKRSVNDNIRTITSVSAGYVRDDIDRNKKIEQENYNDIRSYLEESGVEELDQFTLTYFRNLYKASGKSLKIIKNEIDYGLSIDNIQNYFGWLLEAVRNRYSSNIPVETLKGSTERAKRIKEIRKEPLSKDSKEAIWERFKAKEEFPAFIEEQGVELELFEMAYSVDERITSFAEFIKRTNRRG
ncbi:MAG: replication initiation protein, partial [Lachnospiraceae bacterium]|nr:replication initiation protein [Lachnospiraceae bacterium]